MYQSKGLASAAVLLLAAASVVGAGPAAADGLATPGATFVPLSSIFRNCDFVRPHWVSASGFGSASALVGTGLLASALTANQVIAALISLSVFLMLWIIDNFGWLLPSPADTLVVNLSLSVHFRPFAVGSIYLSDVGFFLSITLLTLLLTVRALARR